MGFATHSCTIPVTDQDLYPGVLSIACVSKAAAMSAWARGTFPEQHVFGVHAVTPSAVNPVAPVMTGFLPSTLCAVTI